jgi:DNA-binding YbaB/EbfC family protein
MLLAKGGAVPNMFSMIKQAASLKKQMKQVQKELAKKTVTTSSDGITVGVRGDMTVTSVAIEPEMVAPEKKEQLERRLVSAMNKALTAAKKEAEGEMSKLAGGLGLGDLLG